MSFSEEIRQFANKVNAYTEQGVIANEESTKAFVILPFLGLLGYEVTNPLVCRPEFTADIQGLKQGEKVDYAIFQDNVPIILIEAKPLHDDLNKHTGQLNRYFTNTAAKLAILTNGVEYRFFTDLDNINMMDTQPFYIFNLLDFTDSALNALEKFTRSQFNIENISREASSLKFVNSVKNYMRIQLENPSDEFVKFLLKQALSCRTVFQTHIENNREQVKKSLNLFVQELVGEKFKKFMSVQENDLGNADDILGKSDQDEKEEETGIITTTDEIGAFYVIQSMLSDVLDTDRLFYKDTKSYFVVRIDDKSQKWICRLKLEGKKKSIIFPDGDPYSELPLKKVSDIRQFKDRLIEIVNKNL